MAFSTFRKFYTSQIVATAGSSSPSSIEVLVVGGGGGGGNDSGGGGGAGGFRFGTLPMPLVAATVTVGAGGSGQIFGSNNPANEGNDSIFSVVTSTGGGRGAGGISPAYSATNGGSGGGGYDKNPPKGLGNTPSTIPSQGNDGGTVTATNTGAGGGGASSSGGNGTSTGGGNGGNGSSTTIRGTTETFAGGGGGGTTALRTGGLGGTGGGGNGGEGTNTAPTNGTVNTGGGGGGSGNYPGSQVSGANGGSGIVIIRYLGPQRATGGTVTTSGEYTIHTFTTSGLFEPWDTLLYLDAGQIASYPGAGPTWVDLSGRGNNGTLTNGPTYSSSSGGSIVFDGSNDFVNLSSTLSISNQFTISAWIKHNALPNNRQRYVTMLKPGFDVATIRHDGVSEVGQLHFYASINGVHQHLRVGSSLQTGTWYHVAGSWDGSTLRLYKNGSLIASSTPNGVLDGGDLSCTVSSSTEPINGHISVARVDSYALSGAQILQDYNTFKERLLEVEYLVVAGGGGGGGSRGAGGGGGGFRTGALTIDHLTGMTVIVGGGGNGNATSTPGNSGSDSQFSSTTSSGGGGAGTMGFTAFERQGKNGGSGGGSAPGSSVGDTAGGLGNTPSTSPSQGNNGGSGTGYTQTGRAAGGGGGANAVGGNGVLNSSSGSGGAGKPSSISGQSVTYSGGGGGGAGDSVARGTGGSGGGGNGSNSASSTGDPGTQNSGGGGGGGFGGFAGYTLGGNGGSGIVIIRYLGSQRATGGTITSSGGYTIHTFNTSGTFTRTS